VVASLNKSISRALNFMVN